MFISTGILFNHEGEHRGYEFVTRKITSNIAKIKLGKQSRFSLGDLNPQRDWGYAGDYVESLWRMLQNPTPDDFVIATGKGCSVREFTERAFNCAGISLIWEGKGLTEIGRDSATGKTLIDINPRYFRPSEVQYLLGDASKAKAELNWMPRTTLGSLIEMMVASDTANFRV
jgi:GDPmannose 4,6-dehydratase